MQMFGMFFLRHPVYVYIISLTRHPIQVKSAFHPLAWWCSY